MLPDHIILLENMLSDDIMLSDNLLHCPKGFPTLPVYTGNVENQTPHGR
jgi:hypothetical protein